MSAYCDFAPGDPLHGPYHDTEYGFPVTDEAVLFERLTLEIFQAGLSWAIILKKRPGFYAAFVLGRIGDFAAPTDLARWLEQAPSTENWAATTADYVLEQT